jgi:hypothetical protein
MDVLTVRPTWVTIMLVKFTSVPPTVILELDIVDVITIRVFPDPFVELDEDTFSVWLLNTIH